MNAVMRLWERIQRHRPYTAYKRYGDANGDLLASGVAYYSFFSVFPAVALAFAVFGFFLHGRPDLIDTIASSLNRVLPNMIRTQENPDSGFISISAPNTLTLTITGVVAFVTLLLAGLGWIGALRTGMRTIFGLTSSPGNAVTTKLRDLGVLLLLGIGIAVSALLTTVAGALADTVAGWVGLDGADWVVTLVGIAMGVVFDTFIMVVMLRLLTGVPLPGRNLLQGALFGATLLTVLKVFGASLIANATDNPLLGAVAVAVGLLFWLNLMARAVLLSAAWAAIHVDIPTLVDDQAVGPFARIVRPAFVTTLRADADVALVPYAGGPPPAGRAAAEREQGAVAVDTRPDADGLRSRDRVDLASGAVVGAAAAGVASRVIRTLRRRR
ncbi:membrane protein [Terracoccus luteus]|nr:YihY/virulence factor BrkB family protein [Terracoccus luteus]MCP2171190.1 membrane protein [Terracoccus luteus]